MNDLEHNLKDQFQTAARATALTPAEKAAIKSQLLAVVRADRDPATSWRILGFRTSLLTLALILPFGGLTIAAESAVPGDWLYPLKQKVNEPLLRAASGGGTSAMAAFAEKQLERRLAEAEKLAETNRLNEPVKDQLKQEIARNLAELAASQAQPATPNKPAADLPLVPPSLKNNENLSRILEKYQPILPALDLTETAQGIGRPAENRAKMEEKMEKEVRTEVRSTGEERQNKGQGGQPGR
jgi:hypothetical protein